MDNTLALEDAAGKSVDQIIDECLVLNSPKSFFLFAGAGSGKTRSLVTAIESLVLAEGRNLRLRGSKIGVITYTNAACDEINHRTNFNPLIDVSTIHSFLWGLIKGFDKDIKIWMKQNLEDEIQDLEDQQTKSRDLANKSSVDRTNKIKSYRNRIDNLPNIKQFVYNPNGENNTKDSLNHAEVIKIGVYFLTSKSSMRSILISQFPFLLVDESQDTNAGLMDALFSIQAEYKGVFCLGLFGDMMQRIYADGKSDLGQSLPSDWLKPQKIVNYRSPKRIVRLINSIRSQVDSHQQVTDESTQEGTVRLFIIKDDISDHSGTEKRVDARMAEITSDKLWLDNSNVKNLILEHHMAASRLGFLPMFAPLYRVDKLRTSLLDGSLPTLSFFSKIILPLLKAKASNDKFSVAAIVKRHSPLLSSSSLQQTRDPISNLRTANSSVDHLCNLWDNDTDPTFLQVVLSIANTGLFDLPDSLSPIIARTPEEQNLVHKAVVSGRLSESEDVIDAWDVFLSTSFSQIEIYSQYVEGKASFDTHQGIKGLEFPRVKVIIDDSKAKGFMFSFEKLFGVKSKSANDLKNEQDGKDTTIERTKRLFYVTASRAKESLAIVAYTSDPMKLGAFATSRGWFSDLEVEYME